MVQVKNHRRVTGAALAATMLACVSPSAIAGGMPVFDGVLYQEVSKGFAAVIGAIQTTFKGAVSAQGNLADAQTTASGIISKTQTQAQTLGEYEQTPDVCLTASAAEAASRANDGRQQAASMANAQLTDRMLNTTTMVRGESARADTYSDYKKNYSTRGAMPNADVLADSLLEGAGKPGKTADHTFTDTQIAAATRFITNAAGGLALPTIPEKYENTDAGRQYVATQRIEAARVAMATKSYADALAWVSPVPKLDKLIGTMWAAMAKGIAPSVALPSGPISPRGFTEGEIDRRYANPNWYISVSAASTGAMAREALYMQALELHMRKLELQRLAKIELLLAQSTFNNAAASPARADALRLLEQARK